MSKSRFLLEGAPQRQQQAQRIPAGDVYYGEVREMWTGGFEMFCGTTQQQLGGAGPEPHQHCRRVCYRRNLLPRNQPLLVQMGVFNFGRNACLEWWQPLSPRAQDGTPAQCLRCGDFDHIDAICHTPTRFEGTCDTCGEYGHEQWECIHGYPTFAEHGGCGNGWHPQQYPGDDNDCEPIMESPSSGGQRSPAVVESGPEPQRSSPDAAAAAAAVARHVESPDVATAVAAVEVEQPVELDLEAGCCFPCAVAGNVHTPVQQPRQYRPETARPAIGHQEEAPLTRPAVSPLPVLEELVLSGPLLFEGIVGGNSNSNSSYSSVEEQPEETWKGVTTYPFDRGKRSPRSAGKGGTVLGVTRPFDRGKKFGDCSMKGEGLCAGGG